MSEPHLYNRTPEEGWSAMRIMLDRAMPEQRRKRRGGFFWLISGLAAILLISAGILLNRPSQTDSTPATTPGLQQNRPQQVQPASTPPVMAEASGQRMDQVPADHNNQHVASSGSTTGIQQVNGLHTNEPVANSDQSNGVADAGTKQPSHHSGTPAKVQSQSLSSKANQAVAQEHTVLADAVSADRQERDTDPTEPLSPSIQPLAPIFTRSSTWVTDELTGITASIATQAPGVDMMIKPAKRKGTAFRPFAFASGMVGINEGIGNQLGLGVNARVKNKLSLNASIGYQFYEPSTMVFADKSVEEVNTPFNIVLEDQLGDLGAYVPGEAIGQNISYNAIDPLVSSVRQWQCGVSGQYDINRKFFVEGGAAFGFGTTALSEYPIVTVDYFNSPTGRGASTRSLNDYNLIRHNTTSLFGGIGYRINNHFAIYGRYASSMDEYILAEELRTSQLDTYSTDRNDIIKGVQVGLRYTL